MDDLAAYLIKRYREKADIEPTQLVSLDDFAAVCREVLAADPVLGLDLSAAGGGLRLQSGTVVPFLITAAAPPARTDFPITQAREERNPNRGAHPITH
jgi:hypothetical protein